MLSNTEKPSKKYDDAAYCKKYRMKIKRQEIEKFIETATKEQLIEKLMEIRCRLEPT